MATKQGKMVRRNGIDIKTENEKDDEKNCMIFISRNFPDSKAEVMTSKNAA